MYDMMKGVQNAGRNTLGAYVQRGVRCRKEALNIDQLTLAASDRRSSVRVAPAARQPKALRTVCVR